MECSAALPALKARPKATIPLLLGAIPLRKNYAAQLSPVDSNSCRTLLARRPLSAQPGRPCSAGASAREDFQLLCVG